MALVVIKSTDYRMDLAQITTLAVIKNFLNDIKPKCLFLVITHCDKETPDQEQIDNKLASFKKYGDIEIDAENTVLFDNTKESLQGFVDKFFKGQMIVNDFDEALNGVTGELNDRVEKVDKD